MKQKILVDSCPQYFEDKVNKHLEMGWRIKDGTLQTSVSTTSNAWDPVAQPSRVFAIIVEFPEDN